MPKEGSNPRQCQRPACRYPRRNHPDSLNLSWIINVQLHCKEAHSQHGEKSHVIWCLSMLAAPQGATLGGLLADEVIKQQPPDTPIEAKPPQQLPHSPGASGPNDAGSKAIRNAFDAHYHSSHLGAPSGSIPGDETSGTSGTSCIVNSKKDSYDRSLHGPDAFSAQAATAAAATPAVLPPDLCAATTASDAAAIDCTSQLQGEAQEHGRKQPSSSSCISDSGSDTTAQLSDAKADVDVLLHKIEAGTHETRATKTEACVTNAPLDSQASDSHGSAARKAEAGEQADATGQTEGDEHYWGQALQHLDYVLPVEAGKKVLLLAKRDGGDIRFSLRVRSFIPVTTCQTLHKVPPIVLMNSWHNYSQNSSPVSQPTDLMLDVTNDTLSVNCITKMASSLYLHWCCVAQKMAWYAA